MDSEDKSYIESGMLSCSDMNEGANGNIRVGDEVTPAQAKEFYNRGYITLVAVAPDGSEYVIPAWHAKEAQRQVSREIVRRKGKNVEVIKGTKADIPSFEELLRDIEDAIGNEYRFITRSPEGNRTYQNELEQEVEGRETGKAYKLFKVINGKLYPPMVKNPGNKDTPVGVWIKCGVSEFEEISAGWGKPQVAGNALAFRPGWHLGDLPYAPQFESKTKPGYMSDSRFIWAECLYDATVNYQERAMSYGYTKAGGFTNSAAGLPYRPERGYYKYRTNPNPETIEWVITGSMKVNRLLSDKEVEAICRENNVPYLKRPGGDKTPKELGIQESLKEGLSDSDAKKILQDAGLLTSRYVAKPSYILPSGEFVDTSNKGVQDKKNGTITCHNMVCKVLGIDGYVNSSIKPVTDYGWARYNPFRRYNYIELPDNRPTNAQMSSIKTAFEEMLASNGPVNLYIFDPEYSRYEYKIVPISDTRELARTIRDHYNKTVAEEESLTESLSKPKQISESRHEVCRDKDGREFNIWTESTGGYGDQVDYMMVAYVGDNWIGDDDRIISENLLGYLQYAEVEDSGEDDGIYIQMIEVKESERRKGIGTEMIKYLYRNNPGKDISWGFTTKDGTAFRNALKQSGEVDIGEGMGSTNKTIHEDSERDRLVNIANGIVEDSCDISKSPVGGSAYILRDGSFAYPRGMEHNEFETYMQEENDELYDFGSGIMTSLLGAVQVNSGLYSTTSYLIVPKKITREQGEAILDWYVKEGSLFNLVVHGVGKEPVLIDKTGDGDDVEQLEALVKRALSGSNESMGRIDESKHDMGNFDFWEFESPYQMRDFLVSQTEPMRIFIDQEGPLYLACKTYEATHSDMYNAYCTKGYADPSYLDGKRYARKGTMDDFDPEQLCLIFVQNRDDVDFDEDGDAVYDDYMTCYEYPEYRIYAREYTSPFTHFDLYKTFGEPDNVRDISYKRNESLSESKEDKQRFIDKFGQDMFDLFNKSKDRLKNSKISTDILYHVKNTSEEDMRNILYNLRAKVNRMSGNHQSQDLTKIPGKYKFLGNGKGYDVYEPLDVESSMALGVGSGWCTAGRYGHAGDTNFKPSLKDAKEHWNAYKEKGIRFFYFLQDGIGKYAIALYPETFLVDDLIDYHTFVKSTNFEIYNQADERDYQAVGSLPTNLIGSELVFEKLDADVVDGLVVLEDRIILMAMKDIREATIPDGVTTIEGWAFFNCKSLTSLIIPDSVDYIGPQAFGDCYNLTVITNNEYAILYCEENRIRHRRLDEEALQERIVKKGSKWQVQSEDGKKNLGTYDTKAEAEKRLKQGHYFKHVNEGTDPHAFFRDSKVRDANGDLMVCYHGSDSEIEKFDYKYIGDDGKDGYGFYFTLGKHLQFGYEHEYGCYLNITKPMYDSDELFGAMLEREMELREDGLESESIIKTISNEFGIDGIIDESRGNVVCFFPSQIKSIDNKNPTNSDNINEFLDESAKVIAYRGERNGGTGGALYGKGRYYASSREDASRYGKVSEHEISLENPITLNGHEDTLDSFVIKNFMDEVEKEVPGYYDEFHSMDYLPAGVSTKIAKRLGYDGVIAEFRNGSKYYVVFGDKSVHEDYDDVYDFSKVHLTDEDKTELIRRYKKEFPNHCGFIGSSMYLLPDGTYLDLGDAHCNSEWVLEEFFQEKLGIDVHDAIEAVYRVDGGHIPENILGFVHVGNDHYNYLGLPKNDLTAQQYNALNSYYDYHLDRQWGFEIEAYTDRGEYDSPSTWRTKVYYDEDVGGFANRFGRKIDPNGLLKNFYRTGSFRMRESLRNRGKAITESKQDIERFRQWAGDEIADRFFKLKDRFEQPCDRDIYFWMNMGKQDKELAISRLDDLLRDTENRKSRKEIDAEAKAGASLVHEDRFWKVYKIDTLEASMKYGRGTKWCTTESDGEYWNKYANDGIQFYYFIPKDNSQFMKYAVGVNDSGDIEFIFDEEDCNVNGIPNAPYDVDEIGTEIPDAMGMDFMAYFNLSEDGTYGVIQDTYQYDGVDWPKVLWFLSEDEEEIKDCLRKYLNMDI